MHSSREAYVENFLPIFNPTLDARNTKGSKYDISAQFGAFLKLNSPIIQANLGWVRLSFNIWPNLK